MFEIFSKTAIRAAEEVVGYKVCGKGKRRCAWWTNEIRGN